MNGEDLDHKLELRRAVCLLGRAKAHLDCSAYTTAKKLAREIVQFVKELDAP